MKRANMINKFLFTLLFLSCSGANTDEARKYFGEIIKIMDPFATATNNAVSELKPLGISYQANGRKLSSIDSIKATEILNDFNRKSKVTLEQLKTLKPFNDFDLKKPSIEYVEKITQVMNLTMPD